MFTITILVSNVISMTLAIRFVYSVDIAISIYQANYTLWIHAFSYLLLFIFSGIEKLRAKGITCSVLDFYCQFYKLILYIFLIFRFSIDDDCIHTIYLPLEIQTNVLSEDGV
jgi:hypothetical protein